MLAKVLICIAATVPFGKLTPKGKYFLIETQDKKNTEDVGETGDDGETEDGLVTEDNIEQDEYDDIGPMPSVADAVDPIGDGTDYAKNKEDPLKPMMTKEGKTNNNNKILVLFCALF